MNGVSNMLPFVVAGGIFIAIAFLIDTISGAPQDSNFGTNTPAAAFFKTIGGYAFNFMIPILAGYIGKSIADRPGLLVGFVGGFLATTGSTFSAVGGDIPSGFLGALFAGFVGGYLMLGLRKLCDKLPQALEGIKPVLIYPLVGLGLIAVIMCAVNPFMGMINYMICLKTIQAGLFLSLIAEKTEAIRMNYIETLGKKAKCAEPFIASAQTDTKNAALVSIADALISNTQLIIENNKLDLENAVKNNMSEAMQDRLLLNESRIKGIADAVLKLAEAEDVIGSVDCGFVRPNGLKISKTRVPLGVIGIIFESRPNVTVDAATLCLKAGNAVILRGGKEAINSNKCLADVMRGAVKAAGLPEDVIQLIEDTSRETASQLMKMNGYLDVLIPRGGAGLIQAVISQATVPVIETGTGNCHVYVDDSADIEMAADIVENGKTQRPSVCNAVEGLLIHKDIAKKALPVIKERLDGHNVEIRGCERTAEILGDCVIAASESDYGTEFLDYIISVKVVDSIN